MLLDDGDIGFCIVDGSMQIECFCVKSLGGGVVGEIVVIIIE